MGQLVSRSFGQAGVAIVVIEFTNDDQQFAWLIHDLFESPVLVQALDPTAGPEQAGQPVDWGVSYGRYLTELKGKFFDQSDVLIGGPAIGLGLDQTVFAPVPYNLLLRLPRLYQSGESIGPDTFFIPAPERMSLMFLSPFIQAEFVRTLGLCEFVYSDDLLLFAHAHSVVGIEINLFDGVHYGWIEVRVEFDPQGEFDRYVPLRWAYETQPDTPIQAPIPFCPADIDRNGTVEVADLLAVFAAWGDCPPIPPCPADIDSNGNVDVSDLLALFANWGPCK